MTAIESRRRTQIRRRLTASPIRIDKRSIKECNFHNQALIGAPEYVRRIGRLNSIEGVLAQDWERVWENVAGNALLRSSPEVIDNLNGVLREKELAPVQPDGAKSKPFDDDIPF